MAYCFASEEALVAALQSGLVPNGVLAAPVEFARGATGEVWVEARLPDASDEALGRLGIQRGPLPMNPERATSWISLVRPRAEVPWPDAPAEVLFRTTRPLDLAAEMLRLGCDRQRLCFFGDGKALVHAHAPPYWTTLRALERDVTAFVPAGPKRVWVELGFRHPLQHRIGAPSNEIVMLAHDGTLSHLADGPWHDLYTITDLPVSPAVGLEPTVPAQRLVVALRLGRAPRPDPPSLWVLRKDAVEAVDALVRRVPEALLHRLLFAVSGPTVVLRARADDVTIELDAEAHAPLMRIANLFRPCGASIEPPLRRDRIRELLAPPPDEIGWLAPTQGGGFRVERIAESAFLPLADWVDYLVDRDAEALLAWRRSLVFDFEAFRSTGAEWAESPSSIPPSAESPSLRQPAAAEAPAPRSSPRVDAVTELPPATAAEVAPARAQPSEAERQLAAVERRFVELASAADAPERRELWMEMARLNGALSRRHDAGLCWARVLWDCAPEAEPELARASATEEARGCGWPDRHETFARALRAVAPSPDLVRATASALLAAAASGESVPEAHSLSVWLDRFDADLDVRSFWLARHALSRLVGGDPVLLGRARDRAMERLVFGLSVERDLPSFLRFVHLTGRADSATVSVLAQQLADLVRVYATTERQRSVMEARPVWTEAYVHLVLAWGFARLGRSDRARTLRSDAHEALDTTDVVHRVVASLYAARIDQALEGRPPETPLPGTLTGALNELGTFVRYTVDRLRQNSRILEPQERLNAAAAYQFTAETGEIDPRGPEFNTLRGMTDRNAVSAAVRAILDQAWDASPAERARLFDGAMDFFPLCPSGLAGPWLEQIQARLSDIEASRRALLLEEALLSAGMMGRGDLAQSLVANLQTTMSELDGRRVAGVAAEISRAVRNMRRFGLASHLAELLDTLWGEIRGGGTDAVVARLHVAAGHAALGRLSDARPALEVGHATLQTGLLVADRLRITRALADALAQMPLEEAVNGLVRLRGQLPLITDSLSTNSHFCLSVIAFVECLVLGYVSDDLVLGDQSRRWLDEDEYLVRRRIHRDARAP